MVYFFKLKSIRLVAYALLLVGVNCPDSTAQTVPMSQYHVSPIYVNPALVGSVRFPSFSFHHRSQWNNYSNSLPISIASVVYPIIQKYPRRFTRGGVGLMCAREVAGMKGWLSKTDLRFAAAYNLPVGNKLDHVISMGVSAGYVKQRIEPRGVQWGSQYDADLGYVSSATPSVNFVSSQVNYATVEAGVIWSYHTYKNRLLNPWQLTSGLTVSNMNRPNISFTGNEQRLSWLMKWYGGASYYTSNWKISPQALVLWNKTRSHISLGAYSQYRVSNEPNLALLGGLWYRWKDAVAVSGGVLHRNIQIALSVDLARNPTINYFTTGHAWEASLVYKLTDRKPGPSRRSIPLI